MICILHGYLLEGSGSNLWTQSMLRALCQAGETVHVMCQEPHPEKFDFVAQAIRYDQNLEPWIFLQRNVSYPGKCILHKPNLGRVLPVYVWDKYEEHENVVPVVELDDATLADYVRRNVAVLEKIVVEHSITALHANHAVLMSLVAEQVSQARSIPFTIMPHASDIEYAVKKDKRFYEIASEAFRRAGRIFVSGPEIRSRLKVVFADIPGLQDKIIDLNLGVDTSLFEPIAPAARSRNILQLQEMLLGVERGKNSDLTKTMRHRLGDTIGQEVLRKVLTQASDYSAKHPDADVEAKLSGVDWEKEKIITFVGRLIARNGVQCVIVAFPSILQQEPQTRLLIMGHGPLRETMEAMLWALDNGKRLLFNHLVEWGRHLEGSRDVEPLIHVQRYLELLDKEERLDAYFQNAQDSHISERVIFTGHLSHQQLRYIFPCCDVAIFPSVSVVAGPSVFLEAMASGVFPLGVYRAGMAASIDSVANGVSPEAVRLMKLRSEEEHTVADIVASTAGALKIARDCADDFRRVAVERYDGNAIGQIFVSTLKQLAQSSD